MAIENEVWSEISAFLNNLRCGDVSRKSYLHFPELEEAEKTFDVIIFDSFIPKKRL